MQKGKPFEELVEKFLSSKGYRVIARNYRSPFGELDILADNGEKLLIVEVKGSLKNSNPASRVDCPKVVRIYKTLLGFLEQNPHLEEREIHFLTAEVVGESVSFKRIILEDCLEP